MEQEFTIQRLASGNTMTASWFGELPTTITWLRFLNIRGKRFKLLVSTRQTYVDSLQSFGILSVTADLSNVIGLIAWVLFDNADTKIVQQLTNGDQ